MQSIHFTNFSFDICIDCLLRRRLDRHLKGTVLFLLCILSAVDKISHRRPTFYFSRRRIGLRPRFLCNPSYVLICWPLVYTAAIVQNEVGRIKIIRSASDCWTSDTQASQRFLCQISSPTSVFGIYRRYDTCTIHHLVEKCRHCGASLSCVWPCICAAQSLRGEVVAGVGWVQGRAVVCVHRREGWGRRRTRHTTECKRPSSHYKELLL